MFRAFILTIALSAGAASAGVIEGRVIEIADGATLTVLAREGSSIHRVRLAGVDAPKIDRPYGGISRESLRRLARGKTVRVETSAIDARGLLVGSVLIIPSAKECGNTPCEERVDPGLAQLTSGLAWIDKTNLAYQSVEARARYAVAEAHAKANKLGLWRQPPPQIRAAVR